MLIEVEEYWEWVDDKYITYYFSAENDAGFYPGSMLQPNLSMFTMLGVNGGSSSGGGNQGAGPRTQNPLPQGNGSKTEINGTV